MRVKLSSKRNISISLQTKLSPNYICKPQIPGKQTFIQCYRINVALMIAFFIIRAMHKDKISIRVALNLLMLSESYSVEIKLHFTRISKM